MAVERDNLFNKPRKVRYDIIANQKKIRELFSETKRQEGEKTEKKDKGVYLLSSNKKKKRNSE